VPVAWDTTLVSRIHPAFQNLAERSTHFVARIEVEAVGKEPFDPNWLRNAVEHLDEAGLDARRSLMGRMGVTVVKRPLRYYWDWGHQHPLPTPRAWGTPATRHAPSVAAAPRKGNRPRDRARSRRVRPDRQARCRRCCEPRPRLGRNPQGAPQPGRSDRATGSSRGGRSGCRGLTPSKDSRAFTSRTKSRLESSRSFETTRTTPCRIASGLLRRSRNGYQPCQKQTRPMRERRSAALNAWEAPSPRGRAASNRCPPSSSPAPTDRARAGGTSCAAP